MSPDAALNAMLAANLPKGTKWFLVAALPIDDAIKDAKKAPPLAPVADAATEEEVEVDPSTLSDAELAELLKSQGVKPPTAWKKMSLEAKRAWVEQQFSDTAEDADEVGGTKLDRLIGALQKEELNDSRAVVLKCLLATAEGEWLPFPAMTAAIEKAGIAQGKDARSRAGAALLYLSWQIKAYMPQTDLIGCTVAIDLLATRRKFGKETRYRVTQLGRAALAHID
jgi:hypothetical protein